MQQWVSQEPLLHGPPQQGSDSSTGSVTREQILQEVQRQVSREMQAFSQQQAALELENQRLREALEKSAQASHSQVMGRQEGSGLGNLTGPQGSVALDLFRERGGNLVGPRLQASDVAGDPLVGNQILVGVCVIPSQKVGVQEGIKGIQVLLKVLARGRVVIFVDFLVALLF